MADHEYPYNAMQVQPINVGEFLSKYNFHDHLMTEEDKAKLNKMYIVIFGGQETQQKEKD